MAEEEYETVSSCGPGPKHFTDVEELWDALEEYHKYHDGTVMRGMDGSLRGGGQSGIAYTDEWQRIVRQNKAIDRAM
ncbi:MAG: hypothetical protein JXA57_05835, partial [Armatimonadetes bacterium]|nr:hypothetical protein [Armatimonadota bacterium]